MSDDAPRTCGRCHWFAQMVTETRDRKRVLAEGGHCMHSPPTATGERGRGKWPLVLLNEWCGQWQERAAPK